VYVLSGHAHELGIPFLETTIWPHWFSFVGPGILERTGQTVFHVGVVMSQVGNVFACRTFKAHNRQQGWFSNPTLLLGVALELVVIWALIYIPRWRLHLITLPCPCYSGLLYFFLLPCYMSWNGCANFRPQIW